MLTPTLTGSRVPVIWFGLGTPGAFGLVITPDCSAALLLAPLLAAGVGLMIMPRLSISRVLTGLGCAAAILVTGNLVRVGVIALAVRADGIGAGYQLGHLVLGSIVSIVCIAVSLLILMLVVTTRTGDRPVSRLLSALRRSSR